MAEQDLYAEYLRKKRQDELAREREERRRKPARGGPPVERQPVESPIPQAPPRPGTPGAPRRPLTVDRPFSPDDRGAPSGWETAEGSQLRTSMATRRAPADVTQGPRRPGDEPVMGLEGRLRRQGSIVGDFARDVVDVAGPMVASPEGAALTAIAFTPAAPLAFTALGAHGAYEGGKVARRAYEGEKIKPMDVVGPAVELLGALPAVGPLAKQIDRATAPGRANTARFESALARQKSEMAARDLARQGPGTTGRALRPGQYDLGGIPEETPVTRRIGSGAPKLLPPSPEEQLGAELATERVEGRRRVESEPPSAASRATREFDEFLTEGRRRAAMTTQQRSATERLAGPLEDPAERIRRAAEDARERATPADVDAYRQQRDAGSTATPGRRPRKGESGTGLLTSTALAGPGAAAGAALDEEDPARGAAVGGAAAFTLGLLAARRAGRAGVRAPRGMGERPGYVGDPSYMVGSREFPKPLAPEDLSRLSEAERRVAAAREGPIRLPSGERETMSPVLRAEEEAATSSGFRNRAGAIGRQPDLPAKRPAIEHSGNPNDLPSEIEARAQKMYEGMVPDGSPWAEVPEQVKRNYRLAQTKNQKVSAGFGERLVSRVARGINDAPFEKGTGQQWKAALEKSSPKGEREWSGVDQFLEENKGKVLTREQVAAAHNAGRIQIGEKVLGGAATPRPERFGWERTEGGIARMRTEGGGLTGYRIETVRPNEHIIRYPDGGSEPFDGSLNDAQLQAQALHESDNRVTASQRAGVEPARYSDPRYRVPGGDGYKEIILTLDRDKSALPSGAKAQVQDQWRYGLRNSGTQNVMQAHPTLEEAEAALREIPEERRHWYAVEDMRNATQEQLARLPEEWLGFQKPGTNVYQSSHWPGVENPIMHLRLDQRTLPSGESATFVHELQSDWHQQGRKKGYVSDVPTRRYSLEEARSFEVVDHPDHFEVVAPDGRRLSVGRATNREAVPVDEQREIAREHAAVTFNDDVRRGTTGGAVPNAPMKKTEQWAGLGIARALDEAVANGSDRLVFATGEQNAGFYDLSKHVDEIRYNPETSELRALRGGALIHKGTYDAKALPDVIGKEAADRLLATKVEGAAPYGGIEKLEWRRGEMRKRFAPLTGDEYLEVRPVSGVRHKWGLYKVDGEGLEKLLQTGETRGSLETWGHYWLTQQHMEGAPGHRLTGESLKVGGEGMRGFYDKIVPSALKDHLKRLGVKGEIEAVDMEAPKPPTGLQPAAIREVARNGRLSRDDSDTMLHIADFMEEEIGTEMGASWRDAIESGLDAGAIEEATATRVKNYLGKIEEQRGLNVPEERPYRISPNSPLYDMDHPSARVDAYDVSNGLDVAESTLDDLVETLRDDGDASLKPMIAEQEKTVNALKKLGARMSVAGGSESFEKAMRSLSGAERQLVEDHLEVALEASPTPGAKNLTLKITPEIRDAVKKGQPMGYIDPDMLQSIGSGAVGAAAGALAGDTPQEKVAGAVAGAGLAVLGLSALRGKARPKAGGGATVRPGTEKTGNFVRPGAEPPPTPGQRPSPPGASKESGTLFNKSLQAQLDPQGRELWKAEEAKLIAAGEKKRPVTDEQVRAMAQQTDVDKVTLGDVKKLDTVELFALGNRIKADRARYDELLTEIETKAGTMTDAQLAANRAEQDVTLDRLIAYDRVLNRAGSEQGRGLRILGRIAARKGTLEAGLDAARKALGVKELGLDVEGAIAEVMQREGLSVRQRQAEIAKVIQSFQKQSPLSAILDIRRWGMLTAPATHAVNMTGNVLERLNKDFIVTPVAAGLDRAYAALTGAERTVSTAGRLEGIAAPAKGAAARIGASGWKAELARLKPYFEGVNPDNPLDALNLQRADYVRSFGLDGEGAFQKALRPGARLLQKSGDIVYGLMSATDAPAYATALSGSLMERSGLRAVREGLKAGTPAWKARVGELMRPENVAEVDAVMAIVEALDETFKTPTAVGKAVKDLGPAVQWAVPFANTPTNLIRKALESIPVVGQGMTEVQVRGLRQKLTAAGIPEGDIAREVRRTRMLGLGKQLATGAGGIAAGFALTKAGMLTGDYVPPMSRSAAEREEAGAERLTGQGALTLKVGDTAHGISGFAQFAPLLAIGHALALASDEEEAAGQNLLERGLGVASTAAVATGRTVAEFPLLTGVQNITDFLQGDTNLGKFAGREVASAIPFSAALAAAARAKDPVGRRETSTFSEAIKERIPGARETLPPRVNPLGDVQPGMPAAALASPTRPSALITGPVYDELQRIRVFPTVVQKLPGESPALYAERMQREGPLVKDVLTDLFANDEYKALPLAEQKAEVRSTVKRLRTAISKQRKAAAAGVP